jgi:hypothetical protein
MDFNRDDMPGAAHDRAMTRWINATTGRALDRRQLDAWRQRARALYRANSHIFEDEVDALSALGVIPAGELIGTASSTAAETCPAA